MLSIRGRLHKFAPDGEQIFARGQIADAPGNFVRPKYLVADREGVVYVVDAAFQNVQMFNEDGELLMFFGGPGPFPGAMSLPAGITADETTLAYFADDIHPAFEARAIVAVTNQFGLNKVAVYAIGQLREGATMADIASDMGPATVFIHSVSRWIDADLTELEMSILDRFSDYYGYEFYILCRPDGDL